MTQEQPKQLYSNTKAMWAAEQIKCAIKPYCKPDFIEICGGLRRGKQEVHDIDIVCWPTDRFGMNVALSQTLELGEPSPQKYNFIYDGIPGEIWYVANEQEFEVMKLIRTGDYGFSRSIASTAQDKGYMLKFSVDPGYYKIPMYGLYKISGYIWKEKDGHRHKTPYCQDMRHPIAYKEKDILWLLYGKWIPPEERSWGTEYY